MKTIYKVVILILFAIGAIAGVFVFAKTQVAPPEGVKLVDQYAVALLSSTGSLGSAGSDIDSKRLAYRALDDKIKRYLAESAISETQADNARKTIDQTYGSQLTSYGFDIFKQSVWLDSDIKKMKRYIDELSADKLTTGVDAVSPSFVTEANNLKDIANRYDKARALSQRTFYGSVDTPEKRTNSANSARERMSQAEQYRADTYLKNNVDLMAALEKLPERIGKSHYNRVISIFNEVDIDRNYWESDIDAIAQRAEDAMNDYNAIAKENYSNYNDISKEYSDFNERLRYVYRYGLIDNQK